MNDLYSLDKWRKLGWKHPFWELLRFYCSLRGNEQKDFLRELAGPKGAEKKWWNLLGINEEAAELVVSYCRHRSLLIDEALARLRTEEQAKEFCVANRIDWKVTTTKSKDHHQSSKTLIATVSAIACRVCESHHEAVVTDPTRRCVWCVDNHLHVTARNLDGAIPAVRDPYVVWEIKEYWGKTSGGSKMSDAVYECHLVGRELREFEERAKHRIHHLVFVDGKDQWNARKSDLARLIDLHNQGLIDHLFIGNAVETEWAPTLSNILKIKAPQ